MGECFRKNIYIYIYSQTSVQTQLHDVTKTGRDVSSAWNEHRRKSVTGRGREWQPLESHISCTVRIDRSHLFSSPTNPRKYTKATQSEKPKGTATVEMLRAEAQNAPKYIKWPREGWWEQPFLSFISLVHVCFLKERVNLRKCV